MKEKPKLNLIKPSDYSPCWHCNVWCQQKKNTSYLNKPEAKGCKFVYVYMTLPPLPPGIVVLNLIHVPCIPENHIEKSFYWSIIQNAIV